MTDFITSGLLDFSNFDTPSFFLQTEPNPMNVPLY